MSESVENENEDVDVDADDGDNLPGGKPSRNVKMTVTLPRSVAAFLRWKAESEGMRRDELLRRIITHYAQKLRARDMATPPIVDE